MFSRVALLLAIFGVPLMHNLICPVKGQCTVKGCETGDSSISIVAEIQQMFAEFHERLQAIDRRSQEQDRPTCICIKQVQNIYELLNASVHQMSSFNESLKQLQYQQDAVMTSHQTFDQHALRQDVCTKEVHELLNASFQQMTNQYSSVLRRFDEAMELLRDRDIYTKNQSQDLRTPTTGVPLQQNTVTGSEGDLALFPSANNWTIIMNRFNGSLNFNRSWTEYKNGFGDFGRGEFWLGNENIHRLTNRSGVVYALRVEVQLRTSGVWYSADYSTFSLDSENSKYAFRLSGFSGGNAGDYLISGYNLDGMNFTTWDSDNDRTSYHNCASLFRGGWWFNACHLTCLTCTYIDQFYWLSLNHVSSDRGLLRAARMMIRSK